MSHPDPEQDGKGELKDCPFCGKEPEIGDDGEGVMYHVYCGNQACATSQNSRGVQEAIKAWNTRYQPLLAQKDAEIQELKNAKEALTQDVILHAGEIERLKDKLLNHRYGLCNLKMAARDYEIKRLKEQVGAMEKVCEMVGSPCRFNHWKELQDAIKDYLKIKSAKATPTDNTKTNKEL